VELFLGATAGRAGGAFRAICLTALPIVS